MLIQITTGIKLMPIKKIDKKRTLCKCYENNLLWKKGRKNIYYESDLRRPNLFDYTKEVK